MPGGVCVRVCMMFQGSAWVELDREFEAMLNARDSPPKPTPKIELPAVGHFSGTGPAAYFANWSSRMKGWVRWKASQRHWAPEKDLGQHARKEFKKRTKHHAPSSSIIVKKI